MDGKVRRKVAMGTGARDFGRSHPVDSPEFILIMGELDELLGLVQIRANQQREGFIDRHAVSSGRGVEIAGEEEPPGLLQLREIESAFSKIMVKDTRPSEEHMKLIDR
jgi:hypothetical protein